MASKQRPGREAKKPKASTSKATGVCLHPKKQERHVGWGVICGACGVKLR